MSPFLRRLLARSPVARALLGPAAAVRRRLLASRQRQVTAMYERLRDLLVEDPVIRLAEFDGAEFQLDARSHLFGRCVLMGHYEPELVRLCAAHLDPARDAVDVGANVGFFSVFMARRLPGRRVLAVEPAPAVRRRLEANLARNGVADRVVVFAGAAAEARRTATLHHLEGREEYATLGASFHPAVAAEASAAGALEVEAAPLDDLVADHGLAPGFVKVDVEGAEHIVLAGAGEVLREHRPVLLVEVSDPLLRANGSSAGEVLAVLRDARYRLVNAHDVDVAAEVYLRSQPFGEVLALPLR